MALTGHLSDLSLSELIEFFCNQRKTGRLKVLYSQGPGYFYLQTGSVVDARIGVLRGIDAVYFALTLPNAKFEFSGSEEASEKTINQPWTQVVLEGLRRLDEGIVPPEAFPATYLADDLDDELHSGQTASAVSEVNDASFLSFLQSESVARRKPYMIGAATVAVLALVAVVGVPAGWYSRAKQAPVVAEQTEVAPAETQPAPAATDSAVTAPVPVTDSSSEADSLAARRQRERDKARAREERAGQVNNPGSVTASTPDSAKGGPKKVTVTVSYDESGRVTQASGADATAVRIARQRRFPAGKAGSATITIPIN
jgi:hypothetical protein